MTQPGRNDPCPCGSGKKYKQCHMVSDQGQSAARADQAREQRARLEAMGRPDTDDMRSLYKELIGRNLSGEVIPEKVQASLVDVWRQRRLVERARATLAEHGSELEARFQEDPAAFESVSRSLATELDLSHYELTNVNRRKVLLALGALPEDAAKRRAYADAACRLVLEDEDRRVFSEGLEFHLQSLIDAERWPEAFVLDRCAARVLDASAEASAFLEDVVVRSLSQRRSARR
jgi:hypothetical protein